jgi:hypothetical protein
VSAFRLYKQSVSGKVLALSINPFIMDGIAQCLGAPETTCATFINCTYGAAHGNINCAGLQSRLYDLATVILKWHWSCICLRTHRQIPSRRIRCTDIFSSGIHTSVILFRTDISRHLSWDQLLRNSNWRVPSRGRRCSRAQSTLPFPHLCRQPQSTMHMQYYHVLIYTFADG